MKLIILKDNEKVIIKDEYIHLLNEIEIWKAKASPTYKYTPNEIRRYLGLTPFPPNKTSDLKIGDEKNKTIIIFRCASIINGEIKELIRKDLKKQIEEGIVVTDISLEYVKTLLPEDCECDVVIESMSDE